MRYLTILSILLFFSCNKKIELPNLDESAWQRDMNGCSNIRSTLTEALNKDKELLKGLNQDELISVLGKPDQNELYKRNQKFFIYNITPTNCPNEADKSPRQYLSIRFNATGLAKEVVIYEE